MNQKIITHEGNLQLFSNEVENCKNFSRIILRFLCKCCISISMFSS